MVENSDTLFKNEIYRVDRPLNEKSKNIIFCRGGTAAKFLGKWPITGNLVVMQSGEWSILVENTGLYSLVSRSLHYFGFPTCQSKFFAED